jgi:hypothetical protein
MGMEKERKKKKKQKKKKKTKNKNKERCKNEKNRDLYANVKEVDRSIPWAGPYRSVSNILPFSSLTRPFYPLGANYFIHHKYNFVFFFLFSFFPQPPTLFYFFLIHSVSRDEGRRRKKEGKKARGIVLVRPTTRRETGVRK